MSEHARIVSRLEVRESESGDGEGEGGRGDGETEGGERRERSEKRGERKETERSERGQSETTVHRHIQISCISSVYIQICIIYFMNGQ
jgi:hypothetical protein